MVRYSIAWLIASAGLTVCFAQPSTPPFPPAPTGPLKLEGRWKVVKTEFSGKTVPKEDWIQTHWSFADGTATTRVRGVNSFPSSESTWKLTTDSTKTPAQMDLFGPNPRFGFACIYDLKRDKLDGDKLVICWNAGRERPTEFKTTKMDFSYLLTFARDP